MLIFCPIHLFPLILSTCRSTCRTFPVNGMQSGLGFFFPLKFDSLWLLHGMFILLTLNALVNMVGLTPGILSIFSIPLVLFSSYIFSRVN